MLAVYAAGAYLVLLLVLIQVLDTWPSERAEPRHIRRIASWSLALFLAACIWRMTS